MDVEQAVAERYSAGAQAVQPELCCPTDYDPRYLDAIPAEVLERDYGCGDPSRHLAEGETVLDLGSGGGKLCFIASQVVGPTGAVVGVDINDDMLALARRSTAQVATAVGYANVRFLKGRIQDLGLDVEALESWLQRHPVADLAGMSALEAEVARLRSTAPLVADSSVDVVISNCVLNLVATEHKVALFTEIFRVLRRGGRAVISDIVSDVTVPDALRCDPELWSGCCSGAFQEEAFLAAFADAGFHGISIERRDSAPWRVLNGVELRSMTVVAYKGKQGECRDHGQSVIYRGPWRAVLDDDDHVYMRGAPTAVCAKTFELLGRAPYADRFERLEPAERVDPQTAPLFACAPPAALSAPGAPDAEGALRRPVTGMGVGSPGGCC
ncbi:MAG: methyltransferase domain-containing protein [Acidimicrobiales bacterium]